MLFVRMREKTQILALQFRFVLFLDKPVLFVDNGILWQYFDSLMPKWVEYLIVLTRNGKELWKLHLEADADVGFFGEQAVLFYGKNRELTL